MERKAYTAFGETGRHHSEIRRTLHAHWACKCWLKTSIRPPENAEQPPSSRAIPSRHLHVTEYTCRTSVGRNWVLDSARGMFQQLDTRCWPASFHSITLHALRVVASDVKIITIASKRISLDYPRVQGPSFYTIRYDTIRYIYVRSKADDVASLVSEC